MNTKKGDQPKQPVCVPKILPSEELRIRAHENAGKIEPKNHAQVNRLMKAVPNLKIPVARLVVMTSRKWPKEGKKFTVGFLDNPEKALRKKILLHMNAWDKTANVSFVEAGDPEVRIARLDGKEGGYWSYLGTEIREIDKDSPTMNFEGFTTSTLDSEFVRVVRHETGHTMGFPHEHMRKELVDRIDREKAIKEFMASQGWSREEVIAQVLTPLEEADIQGTSFSDENSIMCYQISGDITTDGQPILGGTDIDEEDYKFAARIYPKPTNAPATTGPDTPVSVGTKGTVGESNNILREYFQTTRAVIDSLRTSDRAPAGAKRYASDQVFTKLCNEVYPPCSKQPNDIRPFHTLVADLGYVGSAKNSLAPKTNDAFDLAPPNYFIGSDFNNLDTVRQHHAATCDLLDKDGRLLP